MSSQAQPGSVVSPLLVQVAGNRPAVATVKSLAELVSHAFGVKSTTPPE